MDLLDENESKQPLHTNKKMYRGKYAGVALKLERAEQQMNRARIALFVLAALVALGGLLQLNQVAEVGPLEAILSFSLAIVFGLAGFFAKKHPSVSIGVALALYLALQILATIEDSSFLFRGLFWKILIITVLGMGFASALVFRKYKAELEQADLEELLDKEA